MTSSREETLKQSWSWSKLTSGDLLDKFKDTDVNFNNSEHLFETVNRSTATVRDVMSGERILITGATGTVGSVLLEKLLRCCPEIDTIFVLLRSKDGCDVRERLQKLFTSPLYAAVPVPVLDKVVVMQGDVSLPDLGLSTEDCDILVHNVGIVLHCAANVSFGAGLRSAVNANLTGSKRVLDLCHLMGRIKSLVYVSTAYANYSQREANERLYPVTCDPNEVIQLVQRSTEEELKKMTKKLCGAHPNTYTFTKHLAEHLLAREHGNIPLAIVRPSIVLGTWKEPFPGWLPIGYGASGFIAGTGKGVFRTVPASPKKTADLVPSDVVVNAIIAAAWGLAQPGAKQLQIYHVTSSTRNPVTWGEYTGHVVRAWRDEFPCKALAWVPDCKCRPEVWRNRLVFRLCQLWPSYLVDFVESNTRASHNRHKKESLVSVQRRFIRGMELMSHFSQRQWSFHNPNLCELHKKLSPEDQQTFSVELLEVDWTKFINSCVLNVRQHFFKDPIVTLPQAKTYIRRWRAINFCSQVLLLFLIYSIFGIFLIDTQLFIATIFMFLLFQWL